MKVKKNLRGNSYLAERRVMLGDRAAVQKFQLVPSSYLGIGYWG